MSFFSFSVFSLPLSSLIDPCCLLSLLIVKYSWSHVSALAAKTQRQEGWRGEERGIKQTSNASHMQPWLLSTPLIVSGSVGDATFFSPLLSIWCHRKWNFISYSAAIALDEACQDKADSFLQICLSCGTINHRALAAPHTCFLHGNC